MSVEAQRDPAVVRRFSLALYLGAIGRPDRARMVACGVESVSAGLDSEAMVELAGASDELPLETLWELFFAATEALGFDLPRLERARVWAASVADDFDAHPDVPQRTPARRFCDDLLVLLDRLAVHGDPTVVQRFVGHARRFDGGGIDDYAEWLVELRRLGEGMGAERAIGLALVELLERVSFGAIEPWALRRIRALRRSSWD